jgi:hypothetical protein
MNRAWNWPSRFLILAFALFIAIGAGLIGYAETFPVYSDASAPERISKQLRTLPNDKARFSQWHSQLSAYETPHKRLFDWGVGLIAAGIGLALPRPFYFSIRKCTKAEGPRWSFLYGSAFG